MRVIPPIEITDARLTATSVSPEDPGVEWAPGAYSQGDQRWKATTHLVYEVVAASTSDDPETGVLADPATWIVVGPTNRWALFDDGVGTSTTGSSPMTYTITPGERINAIGFVNISGVDEIRVEVTSATGGGVVYDVTQDLQDVSFVDGFYNWLFGGIRLRSRAIFDAIPNYLDNVINITATGAAPSIGNMVIGSELTIGTTLEGFRPGVTSYSRVETNEFGVTTIQKRPTSREMDAEIIIDNVSFDYIIDQLQALDSTVMLWVASDRLTSGIVYGFYADWQPSYIHGISRGTITIKGLI